MYVGYRMSKQDWKELLEMLRNTEGVTISYFPPVDSEGFFEEFKYVTFEYNGLFFYMDDSDFKFTITAYKKVSPYEKQQIEYPEEVHDFEGIMKHVTKQRKVAPFRDSFKQRIYLTELYGLSNGTTVLWKLQNELAGYREKEIISNLDRIEMTENNREYTVLRFWHKNGEEYFEYECKTKRITN